MNVERFKVEDVGQALMAAKGIASLAAKHLEAKYGACTSRTVRNYVKRYPELKEVVVDAEEDMKDLAENRLYKSISEGEGQMIRWFLGTKGKDRGYTTRVENTGADGKLIKIVTEVNLVDVFSSLNAEERDKVRELRAIRSEAARPQAE